MDMKPKDKGFMEFPLVVLIIVWWGVVEGAIEFCSPGRTKSVYRITGSECPYGVLFKLPVDTGCFKTSDADVDNYKADVCENLSFLPESTQIQLISSIDDSEAPGSCSRACSSKDIVEITKDILTPPSLAVRKQLDMIEDLKDSEIKDDVPDIPGNYRNNSKILAQTQRMFMHLIKLKYPSEEEIQQRINDNVTDWYAWSTVAAPDPKGKLNNPPRIIKMLEMSFRILHTHVDDRYVPRDFKSDLENAFIFLVQETYQASGILQDIPEDDYIKIMESLSKCLTHKVPFELVGKRCRTWSEIDYISKGGKKIIPKADKFSYKYGHYDLPIDGAWATLSFVHGLCYGTFKEYVNYHHLYERAIEKLFNLKEIMYRWKRPPTLHHEHLWNKMFSSPNVNQTMKNLDGFIQAAYSGSPFLHRLERSMFMYPLYSGGSSIVSSENTGGNGGTGGGGSSSGGGTPNGHDNEFLAEDGTPEVHELPKPATANDPNDANGGNGPSGPSSDPGSGNNGNDPGSGSNSNDPGSGNNSDPGSGNNSTDPGSGDPSQAPAGPPPPPSSAPEQPPTDIQRKKRKKRDDIEDFGLMMYDTEDIDLPITIEELGLTHGGWCFQTEDERRNGILTFILEKCGRSPVTYDLRSNLPWLYESPKNEDTDQDEEIADKDEL